MSGSFSRRSFLRASGTAAGIGFLSGQAGAQATGPSGEYVVGTASRTARRVARSRAENVGRELDFGTIGSAVSGRFPPEAIEALEKRDDVRYIEPDGVVTALAQTLPWGIDRVDADIAHDDGATGRGAHVAILDTGIDSDHPDLQANLGTGYAVESCSGTDCNYAWDDDHSHGTHCAGIVNAIDNSAGVVGVATQAILHAVKVLDGNGSGTFSGVAQGLTWVADQGYDVASMSLGASSGSQTIEDACQYAHDNDVLVVAAAGNDGPCSDCVGYPAAYSTVVAVSALHDSDELAGYSSTGPEVELIAPGSQIYSTVVGGYGTMSGTSMACPHVAGAAGQLVAAGYTSADARSRLQSTAEDLGLPSNEQGHGLLDVAGALGLDSSSIVDVRSDDATDIGETSVTLNGRLTDLGNSDSVDVGFKYHNLDTGNASLTDTTTLTSMGTYSMTVTGLDAGATYEFQAKAWEADGDSDEGTWLSFTTGTTDTNVAVATGHSPTVGTTTATLDGELTDLGGASSADCAFEYREAGTSTWSSTSSQTLDATGAYSQKVSGLSSGMDYELRATATASDGDTDTGSTVSFFTATEDTNVVVDTGTASSVGETSATLSGSLTDFGGASSADVYFEWGPSGGSRSNTTGVQTVSSTGSFDATISGLSGSTDYEFAAVAIASDGDTDTGQGVSFTTDSGSTNTVPTIDRYSVTEAGSPNPHAEITASWAVSDADGDLANVEVVVLTTSGTVVDRARTWVSGGSASGRDQFKFKHGGGANYDVRVVVSDNAGNTASQTNRVSS